MHLDSRRRSGRGRTGASSRDRDVNSEDQPAYEIGLEKQRLQVKLHTKGAVEDGESHQAGDDGR